MENESSGVLIVLQTKSDFQICRAATTSAKRSLGRGVDTEDEKKNRIADAKRFLEKKNFMEAVDILEQTVGRLNAYVQHVILRRFNNEAKMAKASYMIDEKDTGLWGSYLNRFPSRKYLTLNYDPVIENVIGTNLMIANISLSNIKSLVKSLTPLDFIDLRSSGQKIPENGYVVYHLHGLSNKPDTIIFSSTNYDDFYGTINTKQKLTRGFPKELDRLNRDYSFLFIGCSLNNTQDRIYDTLCSINRDATIEQFHYAFLNRNEIREEKELDKKEDELLSSNIKVLWYSAVPENDNEYQQAIKDLCEILLPVTEIKEEIDEINIKQFEEKGQQIDIPLKYFRGGDYKFYIVAKEGVFYLTDKGATYEKLDLVFELKERDVQKNLSAIAGEYKENGLTVVKTGKEEKQRWIMVKLGSIKYGNEVFKREVEEAKHILIACISFMDTMRIFYR